MVATRLDMRYRIHAAMLVLSVCGVLALAQQRVDQRQDRASVEGRLVDGLQDERISEMRLRIDRVDREISALIQHQQTMQQAVDRIVGIGIGFGTMLTILQGIIVVLQWRAKK